MQQQVKHIVAITGHKRSGKDTAAQVLIEAGYMPFQFANPMKQMLMRLLKVQGVATEEVNAMLYGDLKETPSLQLGGRTPRHALETIGTEWGRNLMNEHLWIDVLCNAITASNADKVVVTDLRLLREQHFLDRRFGPLTTLRIQREGTAPQRGAMDLHNTVAEIDDMLATNIQNDGSIELLHSRVGLVCNL